jgi:hypothetical protein
LAYRAGIAVLKDDFSLREGHVAVDSNYTEVLGRG